MARKVCRQDYCQTQLYIWDTRRPLFAVGLDKVFRFLYQIYQTNNNMFDLYLLEKIGPS